jgi:multidrug efflux pump subunit AcrA (membrane-fusion protein)
MLGWAAFAVVLLVAIGSFAYGAARSARLTREHEVILARERAKLRSADAELGRLEAELARLRADAGPGATTFAAREAQLVAKDAQLTTRAADLMTREDALKARVADVERRERAQVERAEPHPVLVVPTPKDVESDLGRTQMLAWTATGASAPDNPAPPAPATYERSAAQRERLGRDLAHMELGQATRAELPRLLDAVATSGGFASVVLADEVGLLLASNAEAVRPDLVAGVWSMLTAVCDRVERVGAPVPLAFVVLDASHGLSVHRLFRAGDNRFVLTALAHGADIVPDALDPALGKLMHLLTR